MNKISTMVMFFAVLSIPMSMGLQEAFAGTSPDETPLATVTINPTCGTTAEGTLNYPALNVGQTTADADEPIITLTNTGNRDVDIVVSGTDWLDQATQLITVMQSTQSHFSLTDDDPYNSGTSIALPETGTATADVRVTGVGPGALTPQEVDLVYWKVQIVLEAAASDFQDVAQQTVTFAFDCPGA